MIQMNQRKLPSPVMVRMPEEMEQALKEIAKHECDSVSGVIRRIVKADLNARELMRAMESRAV